jgi:hypothetical protein
MAGIGASLKFAQRSDNTARKRQPAPSVSAKGAGVGGETGIMQH